MTRHVARFGRLVGYNQRKTFKVVNARILIEKVPEMEVLLALARPPRRLVRRASVDQRIEEPQPIRKRRNLAPPSGVLAPKPIDRA